LGGEAKQPEKVKLPPMGPTVTGTDGLQYSYNPVTGLNEIVGKTTINPSGYAERYNPRTGKNEVVGTVGFTGDRYLPWEQDPRNPQAEQYTGGKQYGLTATQQLEYDTQLRDLDRETDALIQELRGSIGGRQRQATQAIQRAGREGAGSSQDIASELAELGMDVSPGQYDVTLEGIARDTALKQAQERRDLANFISSISGRISAAERARTEGKQDLTNWRLAQEIENAEAARREAEILAGLGG
jgi:hypothetical protein